MNTHKIFQKLYKQLNSEQRKAVDSIEGPVMVIAGPGTGKTHLLSIRIANILIRTDTPADSILALTFTESGVFAVRRKLVTIMGSAGYRVRIYTFHGFCNEIIRNYPDEFDRIIGGTSATEVDQIRAVEEIIVRSDIALKHLRPFGNPYYYVIPVLSAIRNLKREGVRPQELAEIVERDKQEYDSASDREYTSGRFKGRLKQKWRDKLKKIEKNEELLQIFEKYEDFLMKQRLYDYEDMIIETLIALQRNEDLRLSLQEKYLYILADEHQDANRAQNTLLSLLSDFHESPNIFVVGDEKQAIFRFQGASLTNFLSFISLYPQAEVIDLRQNYRSAQRILDVAHSLMQNSPAPRMQASSSHIAEKLRSRLYANRKTNGLVEILESATSSMEAPLIAKDIEEAISEGTDVSEIAILYRDNRDSAPFIKALSQRKVPFELISDQDILADEDIRKLMILLRAISSPNDDECISKVLLMDFILSAFKIDAVDAFSIIARVGQIRARRRNLKSDKSTKLTIFRAMRTKSLLAECLDSAEGIMSLARFISSWTSIARNRGLLDALELIIRESGFLVMLLRHEAGYEKVRKLDRFFEEFERAVPGHRRYGLAELIEYLELLERYHVPMRLRGDAEEERVGVRLLTAHRAKGLEFERVYISGAVEGHWGGRLRPQHFHIDIPGLISKSDDEADADQEQDEKTADERRLFYVALTRARDRLIIAHYKADSEGRAVLPSQFVEEIDQSLVEQKQSSIGGDQLFGEEVELRLNRQKAPPSLRRRADFVTALLMEQGMAVTGLNNYLRCPWSYFFENLIRIPRAPNHHQLFGIAMHGALRLFFERLKEGEPLMSRSMLLNNLNQILHSMPLSENDYNSALEKGERSLGGYYDTYYPNFRIPIANELNIAGVYIDIPSEDKLALAEPPRRLMLKGILDKIEPYEVSAESVIVVDYKTGRPRSRNDIAGLTKTSTGDYKRQLVFYKLLIEKFRDTISPSGFNMHCAEIDFVEPDSSGKYRKERFEITRHEVSELENTIKKVASEILSLEFWDKYCADPKCSYCKLRQTMSFE